MKLSSMNAAQLRKWLKDKGHKAAKVDQADMTAKAKKKSLLALHGVSEQEYRAAGGKPEKGDLK